MAMSISSVTDYPLSAFGASETNEGRKKLPFSSQTTASYVPSSLFLHDHLSRNVENLQIFPRVTPELIESLKVDIEDHMERRIQKFWQLILLVHKTGMFFLEYRACFQVGKGHAAQGYEFAAAHTSTLPSLICARGSQAVYFGKDTPFEAESNETTLLPKTVNDLDSRLDLHNRVLKVDQALRKWSVSILNDVAKADNPTTPKEGLEKFIAATAFLVKQAKGTAGTQVQAKKEDLILHFYETTLNSYARLLAKDDRILARLCHIPDSVTLNEVIYRDMQMYMIETLLAPTTLVEEKIVELLPPQEVKEATPSPRLLRRAPLLPTPNLTGRAKAYATKCLAAEKVRACALGYFKGRPMEVIERDKNQLKQLRNSQTIKNLKLSPELEALYFSALEHIRAAFSIQEPQKMGPILTWLIDNIDPKS
jgi:hypothetical protein